MKEIKLNISDEVFKELTTEFMIKGVSGNLYGPIDEFMSHLLKSLSEGAKEITIIFKNTGKKKEKKK